MALYCASAIFASTPEPVQTLREPVHVVAVTPAAGVAARPEQLACILDAVRRELAASDVLELGGPGDDAALDLHVEVTRLDTSRELCPGDRSKPAAADCRPSLWQFRARIDATVVLAPRAVDGQPADAAIELPIQKALGFVVADAAESADRRAIEATAAAASALARQLRRGLANTRELQPKLRVRAVDGARLELGTVPPGWKPGRVLSVYAGSERGPKRLVGFAKLQGTEGRMYARAIQLEPGPGSYFVSPTESRWRAALALSTEVSTRMRYATNPDDALPIKPGVALEVDYRFRESIAGRPLSVSVALDALRVGEITDVTITLMHMTAGLKGSQKLGRATVWAALRAGISYYRLSMQSEESYHGYGAEAVLGGEYHVWPQVGVFGAAGLRLFTNPLSSRIESIDNRMVVERARAEAAPVFSLGITVTP